MSMKPKISVRWQLALVISTVAAIPLAFVLKARAGTPYCMVSSTVPCQAGTCVPWVC